MENNKRFVILTSLVVALGGFLMGFDASVISGVVKFIEVEFDLNKLQLGWAVSSLTLTSTLAMIVAGPLSDIYGRKVLLKWAAILYAVSAIASAFAPTFWFLVVARMIGGLGVGASLIIAPMYIAEISPAALRGRMVSFNQLNIVIGISVAFFTNYLIIKLGGIDAQWITRLGIKEFNWRWMLGIETLPAVFYFFSLFVIPRSPRWLLMKGRDSEGLEVLSKVSGREQARKDIDSIKCSFVSENNGPKIKISALFNPAVRMVLIIAVVVAILQQITGINSVFFYAPMIFEQSGIGTDAAFSQAILVGLTNLAFTIVAIALIDKLGRKLLLVIGVLGIAVSMFILSGGFHSASYTLSEKAVAEYSKNAELAPLKQIENKTFTGDVEFKNKLTEVLGEKVAIQYESAIIAKAISINPYLILFGILAFVAAFAVSIGPVMWVLFSELFPNMIRGIAISFAGFINSGVSFLVQLVFPWELANYGNSITFLIYGIFAALGLIFIVFYVPETKGKSLEELEEILVKKR